MRLFVQRFSNIAEMNARQLADFNGWMTTNKK